MRSAASEKEVRRTHICRTTRQIEPARCHRCPVHNVDACQSFAGPGTVALTKAFLRKQTHMIHVVQLSSRQVTQADRLVFDRINSASEGRRAVIYFGWPAIPVSTVSPRPPGRGHDRHGIPTTAN